MSTAGRWLSLLLLLLALGWAGFATGCDSGASPSAESARRGVGSSPLESAEAHVAAINAHDGQSICSLMLDSAAYDFRIPNWGECPKFVSAFIGYYEDSPDQEFKRARLLSIEEAAQSGELRRVRMKVQVDFEGGSETIDDTAWFVERDGRWRLARASALLYAAFGGASAPEDPSKPPDVRAQDEAYEEKLAAEKQAEDAEQRSFVEPEQRVFDCAGPESSYDDVGDDDIHFEGSRPLTAAERKRYASADIRRVEVDTEGDDLCMRVTLGGSEVEDLLIFRFDIYSPKRNPTYLGGEAELSLQLQADGRARLAYEDRSEEDEWGNHPYVPVPARIGRVGETLSFRVARDEVLPAVIEGLLPPWDGFLWGGIGFYAVSFEGERRAVSDDVHGYLAMISHPGGRVFESGARQKRDLPTG
jgi:hypothetical protein